MIAIARPARWPLAALGAASTVRPNAWDLAITAVLVAASALRLWQVNALGYNTDEAVYAGQAAAIAGDAELKRFFAVFRAHPLLYQSIVSIGYQFGWGDLYGRLVGAAMGLATVFLTFLLARKLYGRPAGLAAGLILALMPYHVVVTRQALLDGPLALFTTLTLLLMAQYGLTGRAAWLYAAGGAMGLAFLAKETGVVMLGSIYAFFALSPSVRVRVRDLILATACMALVIAPYPITMAMAGRSDTGKNYLVWQLFRRPNHGFEFYLSIVPQSMGLLVVAAAIVGLWLLRRENSWREMLLVAWILVPFAFFQTWPTKGFQYLLPAAPAVAVLAARMLVRVHELDLGTALGRVNRFGRVARFRLSPALACEVVAVSLLASTWPQIQPSSSDQFLAGTGGVPGGREMGAWIRANVPDGARFLTIGASMANIVQFYGHRKAYGLAVSPNPLTRNPSYEPVNNPDLAIRNNELHYLVWDSFSASRSPFFSSGIMRYADKYNGHVVHIESVTVTTPDGDTAEKPVIIIYEVRP